MPVGESDYGFAVGRRALAGKTEPLPDPLTAYLHNPA